MENTFKLTVQSYGTNHSLKDWVMFHMIAEPKGVLLIFNTRQKE